MGNTSSVQCDVLVIDYYNSFCKSYFSHKKKYAGRKLIKKTIQGFLDSWGKLKNTNLNPGGTTIFLVDDFGYKDCGRSLIYPDYKKGRATKPKDYYDDSLALLNILIHGYDNTFVVKKANFEADDLLLPCIKSIDKQLIIMYVTDDHDWSRFIEFRGRPIYWYCGEKRTIFDKRSYEDFFGYEHSKERVIMDKTFKGDPGDNIHPPVKGLTTKLKKYMLLNFKSLDGFMRYIKSEESKSKFGNWKAKIITSEDAIRLNYRLIDTLPISQKEYLESIKICKFKPRRLINVYNTFGINPLVDIRLKAELAKRRRK